MEIERWRPKQELSKQEERIIERMKRTGKLFAFLRRHRHELFDEAFQAELETMYRQTGAGKEPLPPTRMAMATLLQGYLGLSDATLVELTVFDLRVQMVLDCLGYTEPAFLHGGFVRLPPPPHWSQYGPAPAGEERGGGHGPAGARLARAEVLAASGHRFAPVGRSKAASRTLSTCWAMPRARWWHVLRGCWSGP
jgi:hypothetical protein